MGGINLYGYVDNNPINYYDPDGLDALTIGPITFPIPFTPTIPGQDAHEAEHRRQFWNGEIFTKPGWQLEQEAFAAQAAALKKEIDAIKAKGGCPSQELTDAYNDANSVGSDPDMAKAYENAVNVFRPWIPHIPNK